MSDTELALTAWQALMDRLRSSSLPSSEAVRRSRIALEAAERALAAGPNEELSRVQRQARCLIETASRPPVIDLERVRKGIEQMQRGEGEGAEAILARLRAGGEI